MAYTRMVTIATDPSRAPGIPWVRGAQWPFLSDPGRTVQKDLDIQEYTDPDHDPMIPHTLVLKPGLVIHSIYNGYWFWDGPRSMTFAATCAPQRRRSAQTGTGPAPGLREAWDAAISPASTAGTSTRTWKPTPA